MLFKICIIRKKKIIFNTEKYIDNFKCQIYYRNNNNSVFEKNAVLNCPNKNGYDIETILNLT